MKVTIAPHLYKRREKSNGKYPVKLKVIYNREKKFYSTGVDLTQDEFAVFHIERSLQKEYKKIAYYQSKADKIIEQLRNDFTFSRFEKLFINSALQTSSSVKNVMVALENYKTNLENEGRIKSMESFATTINWIKKFRGNKTLLWDDLDVDFLRKLELFMKEGELSDSSIGVYTRNLRTVYNKAISDKIVENNSYPFGKNKFSPPATRNVKKALSLNDIGKLYNYVPENEHEAKAKDLWFFSYFANGINVKDICLLKFKNIVEDEIQIIREKTRNSRKDNQQKISIIITDELRTIIERRGKKNGQAEDFIFSRLPNKPNPKQIYAEVNYMVKVINDFIGRIAKKLKLDRIPTTNFARHSYSTILKRAKVPIELISENLGHTSIKTTQLYLDSFENEQKKEAVKHLTAFKFENEISS